MTSGYEAGATAGKATLVVVMRTRMSLCSRRHVGSILGEREDKFPRQVKSTDYASLTYPDRASLYATTSATAGSSALTGQSRVSE